MNNNVVKTFIICMVAGVLVSVVVLTVLNLSNLCNLTDLANTQLSNIAKWAFGAGFVLMGGYSLVTKRQW
jgi:formate/nitrite transporter FocA (FNT family)